MVAFPPDKSSRKNRDKKRMAGCWLDRSTRDAVMRLLGGLHATHDISGRTHDDGRAIAYAIPRDTARPDHRCWIGYTLDGTVWWNSHATKGRQAGDLFAACLREVLR